MERMLDGRKVLFDSRIYQELYQSERGFLRERLGRDPTEEELWDDVMELLYWEHDNAVGSLNEAHLDLILYGKLGLWNGKLFAYAVKDSNEAFNGSRDTDDIVITCDDKDIWLTEIHHDGRNVLKVRALKEDADVAVEDVEFLSHIRNQEIYLKPEDESRIERVTYSVRPYFSNVLDDSL